jgi:phosphatidylethanolamine-binding protein (PEBP) family uncharacterized protein
MKKSSVLGLVICGASLTWSLPAQAFSVSFDWGNIPKCTSGNPNTVASPKFMLTEVPKGTAKLRFSLKDLDVTYDHGGGTVAYAGKGPVAAGLFRYKSPCPPNGAHTYEWTITALDASGKKIGETKARKRYP